MAPGLPLFLTEIQTFVYRDLFPYGSDTAVPSPPSYLFNVSKLPVGSASGHRWDQVATFGRWFVCTQEISRAKAPTFVHFFFFCLAPGDIFAFLVVSFSSSSHKITKLWQEGGLNILFSFFASKETQNVYCCGHSALHRTEFFCAPEFVVLGKVSTF